MNTHEEFIRIYKRIHNISAICANRLFSLYHTACMANRLPGDIVECGVWRGGSAYLLLRATSKRVHLFDSFSGLPEPQACDIPTDDISFNAFAGKFSFSEGNLEQYVRDLLSDYLQRLCIYKGWFADTLLSSQASQYSMVHLDCDFYQSYRECLEYFVPRIVASGFLVCDEYSFDNLPGARKAVDDYFGDIEKLDHWHTDIQLTIRVK